MVAVVDLPMPIEPVSATRIMVGLSCGGLRRQDTFVAETLKNCKEG